MTVLYSTVLCRQSDQKSQSTHESGLTNLFVANKHGMAREPTLFLTLAHLSLRRVTMAKKKNKQASQLSIDYHPLLTLFS